MIWRDLEGEQRRVIVELIKHFDYLFYPSPFLTITKYTHVQISLSDQTHTTYPPPSLSFFSYTLLSYSSLLRCSLILLSHTQLSLIGKLYLYFSLGFYCLTLIFNSPKFERFGGGVEESDCIANLTFGIIYFTLHNFQ